MIFESLFDGARIPVLGLGTWEIGGGMSPNYSQDEALVRAIRTAIELGYTYIDTAEMYGGGHTEELVGRAIQGFNRQELFLTSKVRSTHLRYREVIDALAGSLKRLGTEYLDLYLIHWPSASVPLGETIMALNELVTAGQVRYLGVSNFNLEQLQQASRLSVTPLATNQVPYSLYNRKFAENGVLKFCQEHDILVTAYTPIEKGRVTRDARLTGVAVKYGATPVQVALNWLVRQPKVIAIPMSTNRAHLEENLGALDFELVEEDVARLNRLA